MAHSGGEGILISEPGSDILEAYRYNYGHEAPDEGSQISSKFFFLPTISHISNMELTGGRKDGSSDCENFFRGFPDCAKICRSSTRTHFCFRDHMIYGSYDSYPFRASVHS
jgi:hypothetical protein